MCVRKELVAQIYHGLRVPERNYHTVFNLNVTRVFHIMTSKRQPASFFAMPFFSSPKYHYLNF